MINEASQQGLLYLHMNNFEIVIFLMAILIVLSAFTDKIKLPFPVVLVIVGLIIGFVPFLPDLALNPDILFLIFLPPLLYDAALKTSWFDFKKEIKPISTLAITLVFFTTITVAVAAHYLIPGFSWPLAFVLGAIISPPDAVAATSIIKGLGLSRRVITIIEGESLVNDASALIAYRYAISAATTGTFILWKAGLQFIMVAGGGIFAGIAVGYALVFAHKKIKDNVVVEISLSLLTPFLAYLLAENLHVSGVLAVVTAGLLISWHSSDIFSFQTRLQAKAVWNTLIFLLNGIVFILIGLQLPAIVKSFERSALIHMVWYGFTISIVTIAIRVIWVFGGAYYQDILNRRTTQPQDDGNEQTPWKNVLIVAWTGTRGVVSLATALGLPLLLSTGEVFPNRNSILLLAFIVILVTLVVQGLTLPLLIRMLKIKPQTAAQQQEEHDLQLTLEEHVLDFINNHFPFDTDENVLKQISKRHELNRAILTKQTGNRLARQESASQVHALNEMLQAQLETVKFQRELLTRFQRDGSFNEETINKAERNLDIEELRISSMMQKKTEPGTDNSSDAILTNTHD